MNVLSIPFTLGFEPFETACPERKSKGGIPRTHPPWVFGDVGKLQNALGAFCKSLNNMAGTTGLEPAASAVTGQRSNQLNYVPTRQINEMRNNQCLCGFGPLHLVRRLLSVCLERSWRLNRPKSPTNLRANCHLAKANPRRQPTGAQRKARKNILTASLSARKGAAFTVPLPVPMREFRRRSAPRSSRWSRRVEVMTVQRGKVNYFGNEVRLDITELRLLS